MKSELIGLTRFLDTYWSSDGVRFSALAPGGVVINKDEGFIKRLANLLPLGIMGTIIEY